MKINFCIKMKKADMDESKIILGTLNFDYKYVSENFDQDKIDNMLLKASLLNIKTLDTAFYYNKTEKYLGMSPYLHNFKINSKANPWYNNDFSNNKFGQLNKNGIDYQLSNTLKNLGITSLSVYFIHSWDYETPIIETLEAFDENYRKERFNHFGVSNISPIQLSCILEECEKNSYNIRVEVYQGMYNLYCRKVEELFSIFDDYNIHFECYNPLAGGLLTGKWCNLENKNGRFNNNTIYKSIFWKDEVVKNTEFLNADISLKWLRNYSKLRDSDSIIIGCSNEHHLENNVKSLQTHGILSKKILDDIDRFYINTNNFQPNYYY